jgi:hypothetical protein
MTAADVFERGVDNLYMQDISLCMGTGSQKPGVSFQSETNTLLWQAAGWTRAGRVALPQ